MQTKTKSFTRWQLELLIDQRRMQVKALHMLHSHLSNIKENKLENGMYATNCFSDTFEFLGTTCESMGEEEACQLQWKIKLWDGGQACINAELFPKDEQTLLLKILYGAKKQAEKNSDALAASSTFVSAKKISTMKMRIRNIVDELTRLNQEDLASLRGLYVH